MINESRYQAATIVSPRVEKHFADHLEPALARGEKDLAPVPSHTLIERMIDAAFWASLRREEGHSPKISLAFLPPGQAGQPLLFQERLPVNPAILTKLSPGVERPGIHLGVWHEKDQLYVWGTTLHIPNYCFVLDVSEPGLLVIKHRRPQGFGKFANVAVLTGDQIKVVNEKTAHAEDCPDLVKSLLGFNSLNVHSDSVNVLVQLAVSMRAHRHGGTLLVVPKESDSWRSSIIHPIKYSVYPSYSAITHLFVKELPERNQTVWQTALRRELDSIAGLTAVDGATIINQDYELLAFGAKIAQAEGKPRVEKVFFSEPVIGGEARVLNPSQNGGTRHLSAAQFVHDQKDSLALVASQDGHFTLFSWSEKSQMVQAYRIDTLLL